MSIKRYGHDHFGELIEMSEGYVVYYDDHAAEVARLNEQVQELKGRLQLVAELNDVQTALHAEAEKQVQALAAEVQSCRRFVADELGSESGVQFSGLTTERADAILNEVRAQGCEMFVEFNRKLAKDYPHAMVAKALEVTELNGEQFAARIRAGEVKS